MAFKFGRIFENPPRSPFIPAERPSPLAKGIIHHSPEELESDLGAYVDQLSEYATQHDVFISGEKKALHDAKNELVELSRELAETENPQALKKLEGEMSAMIEKINGPLSDAIENAVVSNAGRKEALQQESADAEVFSQSAFGKQGPIRAQEELGTPLMEITEDGRVPLELTEEYRAPSDATHAEAERGLQSAVSSLERENKRRDEREQRMEKFAEKYGLAAERAALLEAEEEYAAAVRAHHSKNFRFRESMATRGQQEKLDEAVRNWRDALERAGEQAESLGERQDVVSARFISAREAMIPRAERSRQQAMLEGMDARDETIIGKFDTWATNTAMKGVKAGGWIGRKFGQLSEGVGGFVGGKVIGKFIDKDEDPAKYARASRIIGSSLIMTTLFAPAGAAAAGAVGAAFAWRVGRGLLGWGLGAAAGTTAGKAYEAIHGSEERRAERHEQSRDFLMHLLRDNHEFQTYKADYLKKLYKAGSRQEHAKAEKTHAEREAMLELAVSTLVAGASAYGISHLGAVQEAVGSLSPDHVTGSGHTAGTGPHPQPSHTSSAERVAPKTESTAPSQPQAPAASSADAISKPVHIDSVKVGGGVNTADKLMGRFMDNIKHQFPDSKGAPPALRALIDHYHQDHGMHQQDVLTRFLKLQDGGSLYIHPGDTVSFDGQNVLLNGHVLVDSQGAVHSIPGLRFDDATGSHTEQPAAPKASTISTPTPDHTEAPRIVPPAESIAQPTAPAAPNPIESTDAPKIVPAPAPEAQPSAPTPEPTPTSAPEMGGPRIIPNDASPAVAPAPVPEAAPVAPPVPEAGLNLNGFDLTKPSIGLDAKGNLFSHIKWTGDIAKDNELSYQTALDYATKHHDAVVYYASESRSLLGTPEYTVIALKWNDQVGYPHVFVPDHDNPYNMPPVPKDSELRPLKP